MAKVTVSKTSANNPATQKTAAARAKGTAKTTENIDSVTAFLDAVQDERKRSDAYALMDVMQDVSGFEPRMWGTAIVGFGRYHYRYESGHEGDAPLVGFSPRKQNFALYLAADFDNRDALLATLGKHKTGKGCVYINRMDDVSLAVLRNVVRESVAYVRAKYAATNSL